MEKPTLAADLQTIQILKDCGYSSVFSFNPSEQELTSITLSSKSYEKPVRLGLLLDAAKTSENNQTTTIGFTHGVLDAAQNLFTPSDHATSVRLTEKETAILVYLHKNRGHTVSRKDLLTAVWGYAEDVETHTLETHIYRLRQKIEYDSSVPEILLTDETGYKVI